MRVGIVLEKKSQFPAADGDPAGVDSELLSDEEENDLLSGLRDAGFDVVRIGDGYSLASRPGFWRNRCDVVFNLSVGYRGLDRKSYAPGVLELARIPFIGSNAYALSLTRHKFHAKLVASAAGVPTAGAALWSDTRDTAKLRDVPYPAIVKPVAESSSIGISAEGSIVRTVGEAEARAAWIVEKFRQPALVEEFIRGTEVEVPLIGVGEVKGQGVVAITKNNEVVAGDTFLTGESVYVDNYGFRSPVPELPEARIIQTAELAARALSIRDYGRIDFRVRDDGTPMFMEASTHPHIQVHSSFYELAKMRGLTYPNMLREIVETGCARLGVPVS
jgi:D-alanine-D-alanine ligase